MVEDMICLKLLNECVFFEKDDCATNEGHLSDLGGCLFFWGVFCIGKSA